MIQIHVLPFGKGECFMLVFQNPVKGTTNILVIDSGFVRTGSQFKAKLLALAGQYDCPVWMLLTHIDRDHIGGYKRLFNDPSFQECGRIAGFYYNTMSSLQKLEPNITEEMIEDADYIPTRTETGISDAITLERLLESKGIPVHTGLRAGSEIDLGDDIHLTVLSPSRTSLSKYQGWLTTQISLETAAELTDYQDSLEKLMVAPFTPDTSLTNASSLSVLIRAFGRTLLFLGDALAEDVEMSLRKLGVSKEYPLKVDIVKLSHHGSRRNTSPELLHLIQGKYFLFSGEGGRGCPDKETLARIVRYQEDPVFWFAYPLADRIFTQFEREKYHIQTDSGIEWRLDGDV